MAGATPSPPQNGPGAPEFHRAGRGAWHMLRAVATYVLAAGGASALVLTFGRALCLETYWPAGPGLWCHPGVALGSLLGRALLESARTTIFIAIPGVLAGVFVYGVVWLCARSGGDVLARTAGAIAGAGAWALLLAQLEPGYLDIKVAWDAMLAGAITAALAGALIMPPLIMPRRVAREGTNTVGGKKELR